MKTFIVSILAVVLMTACTAPTEKQFLTESPDIDHARSAVEAYLAQDWDSFAAHYSDTARIVRNIWPEEMNTGFTVQQYIEDLSQPLEALSFFTFEEQQYENIINDDGDHWVYFWGKWVANSTATNKEYVIPVHSAILIVDNKILWQGDIYNDTEIAMDMMALAAEAEEEGQDEGEDQE